jgi:hypothetical protein
MGHLLPGAGGRGASALFAELGLSPPASRGSHSGGMSLSQGATNVAELLEWANALGGGDPFA